MPGVLLSIGQRYLVWIVASMTALEMGVDALVAVLGGRFVEFWTRAVSTATLFAAAAFLEKIKSARGP